MAREWWRRLPAAERREYERSEEIARVEIPSDASFSRLVQAVDAALLGADRPATEKASQALVDRISRSLAIPSADISVQGHRPPDGDGELHGIYRPAEGSERDRIGVWMRTAKRKDVVATRTFLRTLLHEVGHHIDMRLLELPNSYHSKGFYRRESSLFRTITEGTSHAPRSGNTAATKGAAPPPKLHPARPPKPDIERGLALLRAAADHIVARSRKEE